MERILNEYPPLNAVPDGTGETVRRGMRPRERRAALELPTLVLAIAVYAGWLLATAAYDRSPAWIVIPVIVVLLTLHSSLQHEIIHGHPTRSSRINRLIGIVPLSLWLPFDRFRDHHLAHHSDELLTDPLDDSESFYWTARDWARLNPLMRASLRLQQTLAGRVLIGSFWRIWMFLRLEVPALRTEPEVRRVWLEHVLWCVPVVLWVSLVCGIPFWLYLVAMILPSNGILLIRSFAEHRALAEPKRRTAIVEGSWVLGPLFLFNNLHALHHEAPAIPWYQYHRRYRSERERLIAQNGGLVYSTYFDVARRFMFRAHDALEHPTDRAPRPRSRPMRAPEAPPNL
jgi:fatty acid desaturase